MDKAHWWLLFGTVLAIFGMGWAIVASYEPRTVRSFTIDDCVELCEPFSMVEFSPAVGKMSCKCGPNWGTGE